MKTSSLPSAQCRCCLPPKGTHGNNGKSVNTVRRHFYQLICQLRLRNRGTRRDVFAEDLGHFNNLLDVRQRDVENFSTCTGCCTISGTRASSIGRTGALSAICSTVCRCTRSCGPDTAKSRSGRKPPSSRSWYRVPGSWEVGASGTWPCALPRTHPPALAVFCPRRAAWCVDSARAIATLRRSCRSHCLSRRCRLRMAAPHPLPTSMINSVKAQEKKAPTQNVSNLHEPCVVVMVVVVVVVVVVQVDSVSRSFIRWMICLSVSSIKSYGLSGRK